MNDAQRQYLLEQAERWLKRTDRTHEEKRTYIEGIQDAIDTLTFGLSIYKESEPIEKLFFNF